MFVRTDTRTSKASRGGSKRLRALFVQTRVQAKVPSLEAKDYDTAKLFVDEIIQDTPNDPLAILLNSWLQSRDNQQAIDNEKLKELNDFMAQLDPELITSQPMLLYISGLTNFFNSGFCILSQSKFYECIVTLVCHRNRFDIKGKIPVKY